MTIAFGDWLAGFGESSEGVTDYLSSPAARAAVIRTGLDQGVSPTQILQGLRSVGLGMRTQNFYQLVGALQETTAGGPSLLTGVTGASIDPADILPLEGGTQGQYMVNVRMYYSVTDEAGDIETGWRTTSILQSEGPDLDAALSDAADIWQQANPEGYKLGTLTAQEISSVSQWQGR